MTRETLASLRDVDGVYGCLVVSPTGALVAHDLPSWMQGASVGDAGGRIARLRETLAQDGPLDWCVIRFAEHKLFLRAVGELIYTVIARADIDATALRMAMTLTARRFPTLPPPPHPVEPERPAAVPPPLPSSTPKATGMPFGGSGARPRTYRGRRIDEG